MRDRLWCIAVVLLCVTAGAVAQEGAPAQEPPSEADDVGAQGADVAAEAATVDGEPGATEEAPGEADEPEQELPFTVQAGPVTGALGDIATIEIPEGFGFVEKSEMPKLNQATGNLHNPDDVGAILSGDGWMVFFTWEEVGYVKDDDKEDLDADELMESFKESEGPANEARAEQGFPQLYIEGWAKKPFYEGKTNHLTWATRNRSEGNGKQVQGVNYNVRLLGRRGVMSTVLVSSPEEMDAAAAQLGGLLEHFSFNEGQRYAQYVEGDKIAEYGLAGLVLGGGVAAAAKMGLLAKLGKFIKVIILAAVAGVGGLFKWLTGRGDQTA